MWCGVGLIAGPGIQLRGIGRAKLVSTSNPWTAPWVTGMVGRGSFLNWIDGFVVFAVGTFSRTNFFFFQGGRLARQSCLGFHFLDQQSRFVVVSPLGLGRKAVWGSDSRGYLLPGW